MSGSVRVRTAAPIRGLDADPTSRSAPRDRIDPSRR
jgi:hypothetical protein